MDMSFENSDIPFEWSFRFDWISTDPWPMEHIDLDPWLVNHWDFSMRSPMIPVSSKTYMYYDVDLNEYSKISFDYKMRQAWSWAKFYIDDIEYKHVWYQGDTDSNWQTFTTPLLKGNHTIKIEVFRNYSSLNFWHYSYLYLDNFRVHCIKGVNNISWEICGLDYNMEPSNTEKNDLFLFSWTITTPWLSTTNTNEYSSGSQGMITPRLWANTLAYMTFNKTVTENQVLKFDIRWTTTYWSRYVKFYIDGILKKTWNNSSSSRLTSTFQEYTTETLNAWEHEFKLEISNDSVSYPSSMNIDNIRVE